jgi:putative ATPase
LNAAFDESEQPIIAVHPGQGPSPLLPAPEEAEAWFECHTFDHILAREPWRHTTVDTNPQAAFTAFAESARRLLADGGDISLLQSPPRMGERISRILAGDGREETPIRRLAEAEEAFFAQETLPGRWTWDAETLERSFTAAGFETTLTVLDQSEERLITERDIANWFEKDRSSWGGFIHKTLGAEDFFALRDMLLRRAKQGPLLWKWRSLLLKGVAKKIGGCHGSYEKPNRRD